MPQEKSAAPIPASEPMSVTERAYRYVRARVEDGTIAPGTQIVTRAIAREIGASLNPVREAIGRLASEGIVDHVPGAGARVRRLTRAELVELYGMREAIETYAAAEAARLITEAELAELDAVLQTYHRLVLLLREHGTLDEVQAGKWIECNVRFHRTLVDAARNRYLCKCIHDFRILTRIFDAHRRVHAVPTLRVAAWTWRTHGKLLRMLRRRDGDAARAIVKEQLRTGLRHTLNVLAEASDDFF